MNGDEPDLVDLGFLEWSKIVRRFDGLQPSAKLVALIAGLHATIATGSDVYPGRDRLARETGLTARSISTHLKTLEECGLLRLVRRGGSRTRSASVYQLSAPRHVQQASQDTS